MSTATELAVALYDVTNEIEELKMRKTELEAELAAEMPDKQLTVEGIGVFERRRKSDRKQWDHEGIRSRLLNIARIQRIANEDTGEIADPYETAFSVAFECFNPTWRTTALRKYEIDPDQYAVVTRGGYSIQFSGPSR